MLGTLNVLEVLRKLNRKCSAVMITTDKCYDNKEWVWGYRETDPLGGPDPYSASKAASDFLVKSYFHTYGLPVTISNCSNNFIPLMPFRKANSLNIFMSRYFAFNATDKPRETLVLPAKASPSILTTTIFKTLT